MAIKQKEIKSFLARHKIFAADTMLFIYHFEDHAHYAPVTNVLLESWENGTHRGITSVITLLEILVKPRRDENWEAVRDYKDLLLTFPNLQLVPLNRNALILLLIFVRDMESKHLMQSRLHRRSFIQQQLSLQTMRR